MSSKPLFPNTGLAALLFSDFLAELVGAFEGLGLKRVEGRLRDFAA
jgi:hypothetical protein